MTLTIRRHGTPLTDLRRINQALDAAFAGWPFNPEPSERASSTLIPATDIFEDAEGVKIAVELPGLTPEDVKLTIENQILTIRGAKKQVAEEKTTRVHRYERSYGVFERAFTLPNSVDSERVTATFENGVLSVALPKAEKAKPRSIEVKVG